MKISHIVVLAASLMAMACSKKNDNTETPPVPEKVKDKYLLKGITQWADYGGDTIRLRYSYNSKNQLIEVSQYYGEQAYQIPGFNSRTTLKYNDAGKVGEIRHLYLAKNKPEYVAYVDALVWDTKKVTLSTTDYLTDPKGVPVAYVTSYNLNANGQASLITGYDYITLDYQKNDLLKFSQNMNIAPKPPREERLNHVENTFEYDSTANPFYQLFLEMPFFQDRFCLSFETYDIITSEHNAKRATETRYYIDGPNPTKNFKITNDCDATTGLLKLKTLEGHGPSNNIYQIYTKYDYVKVP